MSISQTFHDAQISDKIKKISDIPGTNNWEIDISRTNKAKSNVAIQ